MTRMQELEKLMSWLTFMIMINDVEMEQLFPPPFQDYHGFLKIRMDPLYVAVLCETASVTLTPQEIQVDFVLVDKDLSKQVHQHKADAVVHILDAKYGYVVSEDGEIFKKDAWRSLSHMTKGIQIPSGTPHGFRIKPNGQGTFYFLSIQSPPIESAGSDDYEIVNV